MQHQHLSGVLLLSIFLAACSGRTQPSTSAVTTPTPAATGAPISEYVVATFEDSKGILWFGTISNGVARYDGHKLTYLSTRDGLCDDTVVDLAEDKNGILWIGTHNGLSRYDGLTFTNYTSKDGLCNDRVSCLQIDKTGTLWVGTWGGVCRFNGVGFTSLPLPNPEVEILPYQNTLNWVTDIAEDRQGHLWIGRDGYGVCKYDGATFTHFTQKDGLASNNVQAIQEDRQGHIWIGSRAREKDSPDPKARTGKGGVSRYDGKNWTQFPQLEGLHDNDCYSLGTDPAGHVWIGANGFGVYRFDGQNFTPFKGTNRMDLTTAVLGVQSILGDSKGRLWLGFSGGLFRVQGTSIVHVTAEGPWE